LNPQEADHTTVSGITITCTTYYFSNKTLLNQALSIGITF